MKYFRFVCEIKAKSSEDVNKSRDCINEVGIYCAYLSRMYEYYFPATQTDNVVSITVCLIDNLQKTKYPTSCDMKVVSNVVNIDKFNQLTPKDKSFYIIDLCQQAIMSLVYEMQWNTEVFEHTYDKIISMGGLTSDYWMIGVDGSIEYHSPRVENTEINTHGLFDLGILYWEGKTIMQNPNKGLELIKKAADLNNKHAQKWLERNMKQRTDSEQKND